MKLVQVFVVGVLTVLALLVSFSFLVWYVERWG